MKSSEFFQKTKAIEKIWEKELKPLVNVLPSFNIVEEDVIKSFKEIELESLVISWGRWDLNPGSRAPEARVLAKLHHGPSQFLISFQIY